MSEPHKLEEMVSLAYKFACDIMVGTTKELMPMFVIERGGKIDVIGCPFKDDVEKRTMIINIALEIADKGADAWSFLTESWFTHRKPGEERKGPRPSEDPNRQEGVICVASDGEKTLLQSWGTKRDLAGNCTELVKYDEGDKFESWISVALNKAKKLHDQFPDGVAEIARAVEEQLKKEGKAK